MTKPKSLLCEDEFTKTYVNYLEMRLELLVKENKKLKEKQNDPMITMKSYESLKSWK